MRAADPLSRSIVMDYVPKKKRGLYNSIEGIAWGFFWNFSAMLGGYLIEKYDYNLCFIITSIIYLVATLMILLIVPLVEREKVEIESVTIEKTEETETEKF